MKKIIAVILTLIIIIGIIVFAVGIKNKKEDNSGKITIITSLFPEYDFAKQIGKDKVNVKILLPPGTESHTYEPTPKDIIEINEADLFCYTSDEMEPWAEKIASSIDSKTQIIKAGENVTTIKVEDDDHEESGHFHEHEHEYDPHVWLDPINAIQMVKNITEILCEISPENADYFRKNADEYIKELENLDSQIKEVVATAKRDKLVFGGEFAYIYFLERYKLKYATAYDGCGEGAEPSAIKIKSIIDTINNEQIPVIFYEELSAGKIANMIADETNAKALVFHTAHNATSEELDNGITYISIMKDNLSKVKEALN